MKASCLLLLMSAIGTHSFAADLEEAARLGLERVQRAAVNWQSNQDCFSCHHHTLHRSKAPALRLHAPPLKNGWEVSR